MRVGAPASEELRQTLALLHTATRPDVESIFVRLAESTLYSEIVEFLNKWQEKDYGKCMNGMRRVIDTFQARMSGDPNSPPAREFLAFLKALKGVTSASVLEATLELLFACPLDVTFLEYLPLHQSPANAASMTPDQVKASILMARRCNREGEHFSAGLIYRQLAGRQSREEETLQREEREKFLTEAGTQFLHLGSASAQREIERTREGLEIQSVLLKVIEKSNVNNRTETSLLRGELLTQRQLLNVVTSHPTLSKDVQWREKLLQWVQRFEAAEQL